MVRVFTAQIDNATKLCIATNESDNGLGTPPAGRTFVIYNPAVVPDPVGMYYVNGAFQDAEP